jgi:hypothetical protein
MFSPATEYEAEEVRGAGNSGGHMRPTSLPTQPTCR